MAKQQLRSFQREGAAVSRSWIPARLHFHRHGRNRRPSAVTRCMKSLQCRRRHFSGMDGACPVRLLFAWIALSFMSVAGWLCSAVCSAPKIRLASIRPCRFPPIGSRNAMLLPTYNEDPDRIMARLLAMYESVAEAGRGASFDWFVLSDTTDPSIWIAEEKCFLQLRRDLGVANLYYRHRPRKYRAEIRQHRRLDQAVRRRRMTI